MERTVGNRLGRYADCRKRKVGVRITVVMLAIAIGSVFFAYAAFASAGKGDTLLQVHFVFRHGDRTPTETYPTDPYVNYNWPGGWGALTKKGMSQLYTTGQWIRNQYGSVISSTYFSNEALVESSYADRCIMSAQALLAGLYRPKADEMFVPGLPWRPVPVHATPRNLDKIIVVKAPCPRLDEALKEAYRNESIESDKQMAKYYAQLAAHTGQNMSTITDVEFLYNTLEIEEQNGLKLPKWTATFYNKKMRDIAARSLAIFTSNTLQQRLRGGPLLKQIVERIKAHKNGKDKRKAYLYSAHDITLVNLMRTMGFTSNTLKPDYAATLIIEVHKAGSDGRDREVKVKYLSSSKATVAQPLKISKCATPCLLGDLTNVWKDVLPDNWDRECAL